MDYKNKADVIKIIGQALEVDCNSIHDNTLADSIESWDSLGQLSILVALDRAFDGKVSSISQMAEADSVAKIIDLLKKNNLIIP